MELDSLIAHLIKSRLQCSRPQFDSWVGKIPWKRNRIPIPVFLGFPRGSDGKNLPTMWETWVRSLGFENPLEEGMATHSSILPWRLPKDRGAWWVTVHGVTKSQTRLSNQALDTIARSRQYLGGISKMTEWSWFIFKANHSTSQWYKSMPQPLMLKKLKLTGLWRPKTPSCCCCC